MFSVPEFVRRQSHGSGLRSAGNVLAPGLPLGEEPQVDDCPNPISLAQLESRHNGSVSPSTEARNV
jgi:hypothetical protein